MYSYFHSFSDNIEVSWFCEIFCALYFHFSFHRNELKHLNHLHLCRLGVFFYHHYDCSIYQYHFHEISWMHETNRLNFLLDRWRYSIPNFTCTYFSTMNNLFMQNVYYLSNCIYQVIHVFDMLNEHISLTCHLEFQHASYVSLIPYNIHATL